MTTNKTNFSKFDSHDWELFNGADDAQGTPEVAYTEINFNGEQVTAMIVLDANGIEVMVGENLCDAESFLFECNLVTAKHIAENTDWDGGRFTAEIFETLGYFAL